MDTIEGRIPVPSDPEDSRNISLWRMREQLDDRIVPFVVAFVASLPAYFVLTLLNAFMYLNQPSLAVACLFGILVASGRLCAIGPEQTRRASVE